VQILHSLKDRDVTMGRFVMVQQADAGETMNITVV